tara:strand:+ start:5047 stop:5262 length:216 start_codon:yes stop_codon:yes gene_type:complete
MVLPEFMPIREAEEALRNAPKYDLVMDDEETVDFSKSLSSFFSTREERLELVKRGVIISAYDAFPYSPDDE